MTVQSDTFFDVRSTKVQRFSAAGNIYFSVMGVIIFVLIAIILFNAVKRANNLRLPTAKNSIPVETSFHVVTPEEAQKSGLYMIHYASGDEKLIGVVQLDEVPPPDFHASMVDGKIVLSPLTSTEKP